MGAFLNELSPEEEERLCEATAAELLMPEEFIRDHAKGRKACLSELRQLAELFNVSIVAMAIRIAELRVWEFAYLEWFPSRHMRDVFQAHCVASSLPRDLRLDGEKMRSGECVGQSYQKGMPAQGSIAVRYRNRKRRLNVDCYPSILGRGRRGVRSVVSPVSPFNKARQHAPPE